MALATNPFHGASRPGRETVNLDELFPLSALKVTEIRWADGVDLNAAVDEAVRQAHIKLVDSVQRELNDSYQMRVPKSCAELPLSIHVDELGRFTTRGLNCEPAPKAKAKAKASARRRSTPSHNDGEGMAVDEKIPRKCVTSKMDRHLLLLGSDETDEIRVKTDDDAIAVLHVKVCIPFYQGEKPLRGYGPMHFAVELLEALPPFEIALLGQQLRVSLQRRPEIVRAKNDESDDADSAPHAAIGLVVATFATNPWVLIGETERGIKRVLPATFGLTKRQRTDGN
jgi:hypothetical protein